jgi:hypothetical protein
MNITNNIDNSKHITVLNFGSEKIDYINASMLLQCYTDPDNAISNISKIIHFNPNHPENHNVRAVPNNPSYFQIKKDGKWNYKNRNLVVEAMSKIGFSILETRYGECHNNMNTNQQNVWDDFYFDYMNEEPPVIKINNNNICDMVIHESSSLQ